MESISFYMILFDGKVLYIGSTNDLKKRYYQHKYRFNEQHCIPLYGEMRKLSNDFEDFDFQEICNEECTRENRLKREKELIEEYLPSCNVLRPIRTHEEYLQYQKERCKKYRDTHKEEEKKRRKEYYETHKEDLLKYQRVKHICEICGGRFTTNSKTKHEKTLKHKEYI